MSDSVDGAYMYSREEASEVDYIYPLPEREQGEPPRRLVISERRRPGVHFVVKLEWQQTAFGGAIKDWRSKVWTVEIRWQQAAATARELVSNDHTRDIATVEEEV